MDIYEAGKVIGILEIEPAGLFWEICCKITQEPERLRRIFAIQGWQAEYLGIPDKRGELKSKIPKKRMPNGAQTAVASLLPRDAWLPWRGELDGVPIEEAYIRPEQEKIEIALLMEEALKFPAWAEIIKIESTPYGDRAVLTLGLDGQLPMRDIEIGGTTDETMDCSTSDFGLPDELAACDGSGSEGNEEQGWQAHCPDL